MHAGTHVTRTSRHHQHVSVCNTQEASIDLKQRLTKQEEDDEEPKKKIAKAEKEPCEKTEVSDKKSSRASDCSKDLAQVAAGQGTKGSSDGEDDNDCGSQDSDDDQDEDADVFRDRWAIRKHDQDRTNRLASLPPKMSRHLTKFDSDVVESIPNDISECLGRRPNTLALPVCVHSRIHVSRKPISLC